MSGLFPELIEKKKRDISHGSLFPELSQKKTEVKPTETPHPRSPSSMVKPVGKAMATAIDSTAKLSDMLGSVAQLPVTAGEQSGKKLGELVSLEESIANEQITKPIKDWIERIASVEPRFGEEFKEPSKIAMFTRAFAETIEPAIPKTPVEIAEAYGGGKLIGSIGRGGLVLAAKKAPRKVLAMLMPIAEGLDIENYLNKVAFSFNNRLRSITGQGIPPGQIEAFKDFFAEQSVRKSLGYGPSGVMSAGFGSGATSETSTRLLEAPGPISQGPIIVPQEIRTTSDIKPAIQVPETPVSPIPQQAPVASPSIISPSSAQEIPQIAESITSIEPPPIKSTTLKTVASKPIDFGSTMRSAMTKKSTLPILSNMMVKEGSAVTTNLDVTVTRRTDLPDGMYKFVGKNIEKSDYEVKDFPEITAPKKKIGVVDRVELSDALRKATPFSSKDESRLVLQNILMESDSNGVRLVATDGKRMIVVPMLGARIPVGEYMISSPGIQSKALRGIAGSTLDVNYDGPESNLSFSNDDGSVISRTYQGDFPKYKQVLPKATQQIQVDRESLLRASKMISPYVSKTDSIIVRKSVDGLELVGGTNPVKIIKVPAVFIPATYQASEGAIIMPMKGVITGSDIIILNNDFLIDALESTDGDIAYIGVKDEASPINISGTNQIGQNPTPSAPVMPKRKRRVSVPASAAMGSQPIGTFEDTKISTPVQEFKLFERIENLIQKYAKTIGEGYLPRSARGVYYGDTENIRVSGMNDISVAAHEITHFLDMSNTKVSTRFIETTKRGDSLRRSLTDIYVEYYPNGSKTHSLEKRVKEGFATLLQKYVEQPTTISNKYPELVKEFLTPGGEYYSPVFSEIIKDLRGIIGEYQGLDPLDKIGARVTSGKANVNKSSFLSIGDKIRTEIADRVFPIEKLAQLSGTHFTKKDPSLWIRAHSDANTIILNNINGSRGYWGYRNGDFVKLHDDNWRTLVDNLSEEKALDSFGYFLVARREHFLYQELDSLRKMLVGYNAKLTQELKDRDPKEYKGLQSLIRSLNDNIYRLESVLEKDGFTKNEVDEAYSGNLNRFMSAVKLYDDLVSEDLEFLHDQQVQLIDDEQYNRLSSEEGYASFKRQFYDEIAGEAESSQVGMRVGKTKVSSMISRTGSSRAIINPLFSAMTNHAEITRKGLKQIIYNRMAEIADDFPELFQKLQLQAIPQSNGVVLFPQEKDPNIIMSRVGYKRVPFLVDKYIKQTLDEILTPQNISYFEHILVGANRFFTKGTTGLFPGFALTNYAIDQVTATAQTQYKYIPLYTPLKIITKLLQEKRNTDNDFLMEYFALGGERQTIVGWQDMSPDELFKVISGEKDGLTRVLDAMNKGMDILSLPSKWSEIITRAGEYVNARKSGAPSIVSLERAGRITAPFHHIGRLGGGRIGASFVKSIPFFNPAIQVMDQFLRQTVGGSQKERMRYGFVTAAITASVIGSFIFLEQNSTDRQKQQYLDIEPDFLAGYIWFPHPDGKSLIKLRIPQQLSVFAVLFNMIVADGLMNANYQRGDYVSAATAFLPRQFNIADPVQMFLGWIPQIFKPAVLTIAGVKDFPKVRPLESMGMKNDPSELRFGKYTSAGAKYLANTQLAKAIGLSPIKLDYLLTGYFGRASGFLMGKPGLYNPFSVLRSEYYFINGRRVSDFYEMKESNDREYSAMIHGKKKYSDIEKHKISVIHGHTESINKMIQKFRILDLKEKTEATESLRVKILKEIEGIPKI